MEKTTSLTIFKYKDADVAFKAADGTTMVNATQMAKPFGKSPAEWLRLPSTKEFLEELATVRFSDTAQSDTGKSRIDPTTDTGKSRIDPTTDTGKSRIAKFVVTRRGGSLREQGTWMHEDVALEFARWLSPMFAIWCNDRIKELLRRPAKRPPRYIAEQLEKDRKLRDELKAQPLPATFEDIDLTTEDIALYHYFYNGIQANIKTEFFTNAKMVRAAIGLDKEQYEKSFSRLIAAGCLLAKDIPDDPGSCIFILGPNSPLG